MISKILVTKDFHNMLLICFRAVKTAPPPKKKREKKKKLHAFFNQEMRQIDWNGFYHLGQTDRIWPLFISQSAENKLQICVPHIKPFPPEASLAHFFFAPHAEIWDPDISVKWL